MGLRAAFRKLCGDRLGIRVGTRMWARLAHARPAPLLSCQLPPGLVPLASLYLTAEAACSDNEGLVDVHSS